MEEALDLVNDHLDLARLAAGREVVRVTEVHVDELFSALRGIVVHLPRSPGVTVIFEDLNGVPVLRTDAFKLSQILRNYVVNGLKFTERGEVRVSAVAVDAGAQVCFAVSDTGPGLDVSDRSRIFEEFVQLERTERSASCAARASACRSASAWRPCWEARSASAANWAAARTFTATIPAVFIPGSGDVEVIAEG